ncbi:RNA recognition motif domain-containing protein [Mucilaginibacter terrae]|uniref:RNA recognition motif-containing protein n=1 Tax=Mucilaginibacter terrae TaxID=1955052 RepID=A0ABU3GRT3_9SPHI|nr:RNA-binding protein [Mucilaginibacter terrae]MDT3402477.1 RNA recognition motif-containing protein [Mucilaginibacter terrae]
MFIKTSIIKIFIAKLPLNYDETDIATLFITYGDIATINLITDRETGRSMGYAFVEMLNDEDALNAISHLDKKTVGHNKHLAVSQATERPKPTDAFNRNNNNSGGDYNRGTNNYQRGHSSNQNTNYYKDRNYNGYNHSEGNPLSE